MAEDLLKNLLKRGIGDSATNATEMKKELGRQANNLDRANLREVRASNITTDQMHDSFKKALGKLDTGSLERRLDRIKDLGGATGRGFYPPGEFSTFMKSGSTLIDFKEAGAGRGVAVFYNPKNDDYMYEALDFSNPEKPQVLSRLDIKSDGHVKYVKSGYKGVKERAMDRLVMEAAARDMAPHSNNLTDDGTRFVKRWVDKAQTGDLDEMVETFTKKGRIGKLFSKVPLIGPLAAGAVAYATSGGDIQAAADSMAEDFGGKVGEGSDQVDRQGLDPVLGQPVKGLTDPLETAPSLDSNVPMRNPASSTGDRKKRIMDSIKRLKASGRYDELSDRAKRNYDMFISADTLSQEDPQIREAIDDYVTEFEEKSELEAAQQGRPFNKGTMTEKEHLAALRRREQRKAKFAEANRLVPDTMDELTKKAEKVNNLNRNVPDDLRKQELDRMQREGLQQLRKAQEKSEGIRESLRTPGLFDA